MRIVYSPRYAIDLGLHVFPTLKYQMVHARLLEARVVRASDIVEPEPATWDELALVHTAEYLTKMRDGTLSSEEVAQLELPWSAAMVEGFRVMVGGTIDTACLACGITRREPRTNPESQTPTPVACHIGGGLHHAFPNHGEGFCPFNDVAVAVRVLQSRGIERVAVIDLDVHHGNGTAFIFNPRGAPLPRDEDADADVFTFSMHQQYNYPMWKPRGSLDIGLPDGVHDAAFLKELERALPVVMASRPQCVFYLAGADPYEDDQLGGLRLTKEGLRARDRMVIETVREARVPLAITLAGGYARRVEDTVAIHLATIQEAANA
jgi:acetoin utilization deacetylase AcuC-like enzyme